MDLVRKHFSKKRFGDVLGYNSGIGLAGPPLMTAWCYLLDGVLIDSGIAHLRQAVVASVQADKPECLLLTHHHEDHSGNVGAIRRTLGIPAYAHPLTVRKMSAPFKIRPYQHVMWGRSEPVALEVHPPVHAVGRSRFRPIHMPGHSKDHTVYLEENRGYLFSGDLFLGERIKFFRADEDLGDQLASLKKAVTLDFDVLFCAHRPLMAGGRQALRNKLDFLENFYGSVQHLKAGGMSLEAVTRHLDRREDRLVKWMTMRNACFANMVRSAYHLSG